MLHLERWGQNRSHETSLISDVQTQRIVQQVASGVDDMHRMANTLHRDVKLSNLLLFGKLNDPLVKLCDFGISRRLVCVGGYGSTARGTPEWMAPEQSDSAVGQDYRLDTFLSGLACPGIAKGCKALLVVVVSRGYLCRESSRQDSSSTS